MTTSNKLTFGSLFSGIGGFDLGFERAGMTCRWQVENDKFCRRVLGKHWTGVVRYGDIREIDFEQVEKVDVVCGGFPCQPVSIAGKRLGQEDERWLWPEFARALRALRPAYIAVENVPGLLVRGMGDVLGDLAALGYDAEWQVLSAAALGASHLRERIFIVAYADGQQHESDASSDGGEAAAILLADTDGRGRPGPNYEPEGERVVFVRSDFVGESSGIGGRSGWAVEPNLGRVAHGVPHRVDRLRGLGNAVTPQQAELIGRLIVKFHQSSGGSPAVPRGE